MFSMISDILSTLGSQKRTFNYDFANQMNSSAGLYCFWLRGRCLYVGMSENLQRRITEHIRIEDNPQLLAHFKAYPNEIKISFVYLDLPANKLRNMESAIIQKLRPIANREGVST